MFHPFLLCLLSADVFEQQRLQRVVRIDGRK
jgi:hypothetical protein